MHTPDSGLQNLHDPQNPQNPHDPQRPQKQRKTQPSSAASSDRHRDPLAGSGLVVVDKPAGMTSHDVVSRMRRLMGTRKIGHAGTLDPMATGVLVIGVERGTKFLAHMVADTKAYTATIRLGFSTTTDDHEGQVLPHFLADGSQTSRLHELAKNPAAIEAARDELTGPIMQRPSSVSAIKVNGKRAYDLVREGEDVVLPERPVTVSAFTIHDIRCVEQQDLGTGQRESSVKQQDHCAKQQDHCAEQPNHCAKQQDHCAEPQDSGAEATAAATALLSGEDTKATGAHEQKDQVAANSGRENMPSTRPGTPASCDSYAPEQYASDTADITLPDCVIDVDVTVECSSGTYIRALARDMGEKLGVGGHLTRLRRTRAGVFGLDRARTLDELEKEREETGARPRLSYSLDEALSMSFPIRKVTALEARNLALGKWLEPVGNEGIHAAIGPDGKAVALIVETGKRAKSVFVARPATLA